MHPAQAMIQGCDIPSGATLIGYIDQHPADKSGIGYAVLFFARTGVEKAWDGARQRSLPNNWRSKCKLVPVSAAAIIGRLGGMAKSDAKTSAVRLNGAKGGRPRKDSN